MLNTEAFYQPGILSVGSVPSTKAHKILTGSRGGGGGISSRPSNDKQNALSSGVYMRHVAEVYLPGKPNNASHSTNYCVLNTEVPETKDPLYPPVPEDVMKLWLVGIDAFTLFILKWSSPTSSLQYTQATSVSCQSTVTPGEKWTTLLHWPRCSLWLWELGFGKGNMMNGSSKGRESINYYHNLNLPQRLSTVTYMNKWGVTNVLYICPALAGTTSGNCQHRAFFWSKNL